MDVSDWKQDKYVRKLPPGNMAYFCWMDPLKSRKLVYKLSSTDDEPIVVNIDFDSSVKYDYYAWISFLNGKQRILMFTNDMFMPQNLLMV